MQKQHKKNIGSENQLVVDAFIRLRDGLGFQACTQVPLLGRSVDLAYVSDGCVITMEFKIHDWRQAIRQARDHQLGADYSYICLPYRTITEQLQVELAKTGIGLAFYRIDGNWPFEFVIAAKPSQHIWAVAHAALLNYISAHYH